MKLPELISQCAPKTDFENYLRPSSMPVPEAGALLLELGIRQERQVLKMIVEGDFYQLLRFRSNPAFLNSFSEEENGDLWNVHQIQGYKGKAGFRVGTSLSASKLFAHQLRAIADHPESEVSAIAMRDDHQITGLMDADAFRLDKPFLPNRHYSDFRQAMGMRWSEEKKLWISDVS